MMPYSSETICHKDLHVCTSLTFSHVQQTLTYRHVYLLRTRSVPAASM